MNKYNRTDLSNIDVNNNNQINLNKSEKFQECNNINMRVNHMEYIFIGCR